MSLPLLRSNTYSLLCNNIHNLMVGSMVPAKYTLAAAPFPIRDITPVVMNKLIDLLFNLEFIAVLFAVIFVVISAAMLLSAWF